MVRTHLPDESVFRSVLLEDLDWKPFPAFPTTSPYDNSAAPSPAPPMNDRLEAVPLSCREEKEDG
jgi:hypothetical protein